ncbi:hypothetical protein M9H77_30678 [Catharanthus roseus]|uniref:Uncharacterized protein n=1 Tax=Catharanthus roseus TaxID=4058 RepID=A0ACC0A1V0_CATRO|nr:hypothetical protein M9H77_30678 [Catharanthus roseus]
MTIYWKNPFATSKRSKVRPIWFDANNTNETVRLSADNHNIGLRSPGRIEYLQARRAFLSSYQFSHEHKSLNEKLKQSAKGIGKLAVEIFLQFREEISKKWVRFRVYKFKIGWPTGVFSMRCFVTWPCKDHKYIDA